MGEISSALNAPLTPEIIESDHQQAEILNKNASDFLAAADKARATSEQVKSVAAHAGPDVDSASLASVKEVAQAYGDLEGANRRLAESKKSLADCWDKAKTFSDLDACPSIDPTLKPAIDSADKKVSEALDQAQSNLHKAMK
jgi:hypothetical protein